MVLFFTLLPLYILGNLHCMGMCGPLVLMIGQHQHRYFYFLGRLLSFGLAGLLAGEAGAVLHVLLKQYHAAEFTSFLFGGVILAIGLNMLFGWSFFSFKGLIPQLKVINQMLSSLMLRDQRWSTFLFGFFTVFLPCGQTLIVFSACALTGDPLTGLLNGSALAILTSPSLFLAMHAHTLFKKFKAYYNTVYGICSIAVGSLAICRGLAEMGWISHWILNPEASSYYHIVIY